MAVRCPRLFVPVLFGETASCAQIRDRFGEDCNFVAEPTFDPCRLPQRHVLVS